MFLYWERLRTEALQEVYNFESLCVFFPNWIVSRVYMCECECRVHIIRDSSTVPCIRVRRTRWTCTCAHAWLVHNSIHIAFSEHIQCLYVKTTREVLNFESNNNCSFHSFQRNYLFIYYNSIFLTHKRRHLLICSTQLPKIRASELFHQFLCVPLQRRCFYFIFWSTSVFWFVLIFVFLNVCLFLEKCLEFGHREEIRLS